jgi:origin recognition complex subunit 5
MYFKQYQRDRVVTVMMSMLPQMLSDMGIVDENQTKSLTQCYVQLLNLILSAVNHVTVSISDLQYLTKMLYPVYIEPVLAGRLEPTNTKSLFDVVQPYLVTRINKIYLREMAATKSQTGSKPRLMDFPHYTKFLIIASFLASYNPAKFDAKFFAKGTSKRDKLPKLGSKGGKVNLISCIDNLIVLVS